MMSGSCDMIWNRPLTGFRPNSEIIGKFREMRKRIFKGSCPGLKFQDFIWRYLGSRKRLRIQNSSVGVIFEA